MAKDIYHNNVRTALEKDGWTITDAPRLIIKSLSAKTEMIFY
jgi:hypothetical protein